MTARRPKPLKQSPESKRLEAQATMLIDLDNRAKEKARKEAKPKAGSTGERHVLPLLARPRYIRENSQSGSQIPKKGGRQGLFDLKSVAEVLIDAGLNPAEEILKVMPQLEPDVAARLHAELLQYVQPKLKSIEIKGDPNKPLLVVNSMDNDQLSKIAQGFLAAK